MTMLEDDAIFFNNCPANTTLNVLDFSNVYSQREHCDNKHELLYVLDGKVKLHLSGNLTFYANAGDFLLVPQATPHRDEFAPLKGLRILIIQFHWQDGEYFHKVNNRTLTDLSYEVRSEVRRRLDFMRTHWLNTAEGHLNASIQLHAILMLFYFDLINPPELPQLNITRDEAVRRAKHFINQNFADQVTLKQTAGHIGISPAYLSRMFHYEYGISFNKYLNSVRLEAARELLLNSACQTAEVAERCGFTSSSYFIKVFSRYYGATPQNYTRQTRRIASDDSKPLLPDKKRARKS